MKNSNDTIGNQTRDLPTCSAVPQRTAPPRASQSDNGTGFSQSTSVSPLSTSYHQHPTLIPIYAAVTRKINGKTWGTIQNACCFGNQGALYRKVLSHV